jgi:peptidoglycan-associated lipoprotein
MIRSTKFVNSLMSSALMTVTLAGSVFLTGCTDDAKMMEEAVAPAKAAQVQGPKGHEFSVDGDGKVAFKADIVYFKFDDAALTDEGRTRLDVLANWLKKNPGKVLQIEGHADARGSTEYNLALGERRARSVKDFLATTGVGSDRIGMVSFGEEKLAAEGVNEEAHSLNRRAEFTLTSHQ